MTRKPKPIAGRRMEKMVVCGRCGEQLAWIGTAMTGKLREPVARDYLLFDNGWADGEVWYLATNAAKRREVIGYVAGRRGNWHGEGPHLGKTPGRWPIKARCPNESCGAVNVLDERLGLWIVGQPAESP